MQVWSQSSQTWHDGIVEEAYAHTSTNGDMIIPAGTLRVRSAVGVKWILPEQSTTLLRAPLERCPSSSSFFVDPGFTKGERVHVWSEGRQRWLPGSVQDVFHFPSVSTGFSIPAGSVKVISEAGVKWVLPGNAHLLQKAEGSASPSLSNLKAMLRSVLQSPELLQRHADAVWAAAVENDAEGLPPDRAAWAVEGLATQFGVRLTLEGSHLALVQEKVESLAAAAAAGSNSSSSCDGKLSLTAFRSLCQAMLSELHGAL